MTVSGSGAIDIRGVMAALPHRFPMLLVDRVEELVVDDRIVAIKAVTINEPFFAGHFPGRPIMPGVLIVEALAQAAGILAVQSLGLAGSGKLVYFMAIDGAKFRYEYWCSNCLGLHHHHRDPQEVDQQILYYH